MKSYLGWMTISALLLKGPPLHSLPGHFQFMQLSVHESHILIFFILSLCSAHCYIKRTHLKVEICKNKQLNSPIRVRYVHGFGKCWDIQWVASCSSSCLEPYIQLHQLHVTEMCHSTRHPRHHPQPWQAHDSSWAGC